MAMSTSRTLGQADGHGQKDLRLTGTIEPTLGGGLSAGSGTTKSDPKLKRLAEVIANINELFGGEIGPDGIEGFVKPVVARAGLDPDVQEQIKSNTHDQFLVSPGLRDAIIGAALQMESVTGKLVNATSAERQTAESLVRILGAFLPDSQHDEGEPEIEKLSS